MILFFSGGNLGFIFIFLLSSSTAWHHYTLGALYRAYAVICYTVYSEISQPEQEKDVSLSGLITIIQQKSELR
jgi:hypothetical protein